NSGRTDVDAAIATRATIDEGNLIHCPRRTPRGLCVANPTTQETSAGGGDWRDVRGGQLLFRVVRNSDLNPVEIASY
ncbi:MAG: hypothetical protein ACYCWL_08305, partial [Thauera sp.]